MSKYIFLSHILNNDTVGYGGQKGFVSTSQRSICHGDSSNNSRWELSNHIGTHIDAPYHFDKDGLTIERVKADQWIFSKPHLAVVSLHGGELLEPGTWVESIPRDCDLLLVKTGFEFKRAQADYWQANPGLSPKLGFWLRENRPQVRALGMDVLSTTSWMQRPVGREAHLAFLGEYNSTPPIMLIEDMSLRELTNNPRSVIIAPLRVDKADGSPVTIIAEVA